jgi:hypothetical protein
MKWVAYTSINLTRQFALNDNISWTNPLRVNRVN